MTSTPTCEPWCTDHIHDFDICTGSDVVLDFGPRGDHPTAGSRIVADLTRSEASVSTVLHIDDAPVIDLDPDGALAIGWALTSQATMARGDIAADDTGLHRCYRITPGNSLIAYRGPNGNSYHEMPSAAANAIAIADPARTLIVATWPGGAK